MQDTFSVEFNPDRMADIILKKFLDPARACELRKIAGAGMESYDPYTRMRPKEIAKIFRMDVSEIYRAIGKGDIRYQVLGNGENIQYRILYKDFIEYQENLIRKNRNKELREKKI